MNRKERKLRKIIREEIRNLISENNIDFHRLPRKLKDKLYNYGIYDYNVMDVEDEGSHWMLYTDPQQDYDVDLGDLRKLEMRIDGFEYKAGYDGISIKIPKDWR